MEVTENDFEHLTCRTSEIFPEFFDNIESKESDDELMEENHQLKKELRSCRKELMKSLQENHQLRTENEELKRRQSRTPFNHLLNLFGRLREEEEEKDDSHFFVAYSVPSRSSSQQNVQTVPLTMPSEDVGERQEDDCAVCFDKCEEKTECGHLVHRSCIVQWGKSECPICRRPIVFSEEEEKTATTNRRRNEPEEMSFQYLILQDAMSSLLENLIFSSFSENVHFPNEFREN